jgi:hypothetical protein
MPLCVSPLADRINLRGRLSKIDSSYTCWASSYIIVVVVVACRDVCGYKIPRDEGFGHSVPS